MHPKDGFVDNADFDPEEAMEALLIREQFLSKNF
jgi:hypothetical protein